MTATFLAGGGELGELIRGHDWDATPLGPIEDWPQALQIATRIMLTSRQPIWIGWGDDLTYLYNDPYKSIVGGKHPGALGQPTRVVWSEIWDVIAPMLETALGGVEGTYVESQRLIMERYGYREETYYTFSYSPIPADDGSPGGIICANTDDTRRVIGERQLALLGELASRLADARTWREAVQRAEAGLATNRLDLPFTEIHVGDAETLAGSSDWPLERALGGREIVVVDAPASRRLPTGDWDEPPALVALVPLSVGGVLVAGLNPFRLYDDAYADFLSLVAGQVSAGIAAAEAYEEERRRAEALAELDRAKTVFFSNVSHEFRTPLTLMLGPLEELLDDGGRAVDGPARDVLEIVRRNSLRLLRMVNSVLDFSRAGSGRGAVEYRPTDLAALTSDVASRFGGLIERGGVRFELRCEPLPEPVYVDPDAWEKVVLNLLSNAFKFTLAGEIALTLRTEEGRAVLRVRDTGTGVPPEELPHLFERFHRVRNEQARTQEGTGIGLALVRELVEQHGGEIALDSEVGTGTTFVVSLPLGAAHLPAERVRDEPVGSASGELARAFTEEASRWIGVEEDEPGVLAGDADVEDAADTGARVAVVDDNADMRAYLERILARHYDVQTYPDGRAALDAISADPPALVVTDVMMPRLDGFGLLHALRADPRTATIPVIVVSARAGEESSVEGLDAGADDYLVKPFSARELVARVRVNLELARLRAEAGRLSAMEDVRSRVITTVSHELRTPVSAIFGAVRTLDHAGVDDDTRQQLLEVIGRESERLARITNDILTTETLTAGVISVQPEPVDLRSVVHDAVEAARARVGAMRTIRAEVPGETVTVDVDPARMQQVLGNLLDNAVKYSPDGGDVEVLLQRDGSYACVTVADQGVGIPAGAREQVFHRFYRVDPEQTGGVGGSGLGLYISREIVEAMGGRIAVEPNEPRGSRFVVTIPLR